MNLQITRNNTVESSQLLLFISKKGLKWNPNNGYLNVKAIY